MHKVVAEVTQQIIERSAAGRGDYLARMRAAKLQQPARATLPCSNLAHVVAAAGADRQPLRALTAPNLGIVTAFNDMLSAHQPFERYPEVIRAAARAVGATAQVAGGVPAMCDGVTQGREGMELSLFSRDVIALSTAVALTHNAFDAAVLLGVCDKIVPGLFMGVAAFGHLPVLFVPAGPMATGIGNHEKSQVRQRHAEGLASRDELLAAEMASYHDVGTCTFYGTANSNQMLMEVMGLHVPGAAFIHPGTPLRHALTVAAAQRALECAVGAPRTFSDIIDERSFVNAVVGLMATGGSTNHTIHLLAMARAVGIHLTWDDMATLSSVTPLIARVYPNGQADVNQFHAAGGIGLVIRELLDGGLLHEDVETVWGRGLRAYTREPKLLDNRLAWVDAPDQSLQTSILRPVSNPFASEGGLKLLRGNLGHSVIKISAVAAEHRVVEGPAYVYDSQEALARALADDSIAGDFIAVVRGQGPRANGMPELHKLTPALAVRQSRGHRVAIVTDGRMSGASGKVPAAIHLTPEAIDGGPIARLRAGDRLRLDANKGTLDVLMDTSELMARKVEPVATAAPAFGGGRELFAGFRRSVSAADAGASVLY